MTICYWGTYDREYPRNRILREGLRAAGAVVREIHHPLWRGPADKMRRARSGLARPLLAIRWGWAWLVLTVRFLRSPRPDVLLVGYTGHFDVFPARVLARIRRVPLVFDAFLSLYDSLVLDRGAIPERGWQARALAWVDRTACRLADRVLLDTQAHVEFFRETFDLPAEKFWVLPIGADDAVFRPAPPASNGRVTTVLHFGRYIPLHGLETVVRAARILEQSGEACRFLLVGDGEERPRIESLVRELGSRSVEFRDPLPPEALAETIRTAQICLGIFGRTGKAARVVPNKVYEAMAMAKPIITGDSPAARAFLHDGVDCLLCERGNPEALAETIRRLRRDPDLARSLGENARRRFEESASPAVLGARLRTRLEAWRGGVEQAA
jgi:glycosyltransferase involved in cell wall biosynthesis